jgi:uncharacterized protein YukE
MADTRLVATLEEYSEELKKHLATLGDRHERLRLAWGRLHDIYEGDGAQLFSDAFESASARLKEYSDSGARIAGQLTAKIEELRRFQAAGSDL